MDIRSIEITNQLRSAIRAKLLELGVRYDEELPDYILVMVVNKKSRQQMNNDLHLFLEGNTESFVNWLHDQVLKKLQKVTVKKKNNKEIRSTTYIKEEKEQKKIKIENQSNSLTGINGIITKVDRDREFEELVGDIAFLNEEIDKTNLKESSVNKQKLQKKKSCIYFNNSEDIANLKEKDSVTSSVSSKHFNNDKKGSFSKLSQIEDSSEKIIESSNQSLKRNANIDNILNEKSIRNAKHPKIYDDFSNKNDNSLKTSLNKPKITSVISVKTRLGTISPTKKLELEIKKNNIVRNTTNKNYLDIERNKTINQKNNSNKNLNVDRKKHRNDDLKIENIGNDKIFSSQNLKIDRFNKIEDLKLDKEKLSNNSGTIKSRLGVCSIHKQDEQSLKSCNSIKISKPRVSNVKSRLGVRKRQQIRGFSNTVSRFTHITQNNKSFQEDDDFVINTSLKSHIIAIKKQKVKKQKISTALRKQNDPIIDKKKEEENNKNVENEDQSKVSSKIIVTPRPLRPIQPALKRATQSLLLRAVAEANQSVVTQKKMDPCLKEQKPVNKIKVMGNSWKGKTLSLNLNSKKRFVMEKIQVELTNPDSSNLAKPYSSQVVTEEHLNVVKSLFKKSDDKQKFLVTLNGYNNNNLKEQNNVNEDDELLFTNNKYKCHIKKDVIIHEDDYIQKNHNMNEDAEIEYVEEKIENNINCLQNLRFEENSKKKRKLSPIVFTSTANSSEDKPILTSTISSVLRIDKRPLINSVITTVADKSNEKCRYWPNCTLGIKCAYYHPEVLCSSFPVCKFGENCAYKHPKCKFGSSCTKMGCMFSHPAVQCKYHPYCMKPGCPFSHSETSNSTSLTSLIPDISNVRAKFTWKKKE